MRKRYWYRVLVILLVLLLSAVFFWPPWNRIKLGLDLKGGIHLVLQVITRDALEAEVNQAVDRINSEFKDKNIAGATATVSDLDAVILGVSQDRDQTVRDILDRNFSGEFDYQSNYQAGGVQYRMKMTPAARKTIEKQTVDQALETIRRRVDALGVAEPNLQLYGAGAVPDQIIVELPGLDDPGRIINIIKTTAQLQLRLLYSDENGDTKAGPYPTQEEALRAFNNNLPQDYEILPYKEKNSDRNSDLVVKRGASLTGLDLKTAHRGQDINGAPLVNFSLNSAGVQKFSAVTGSNVGKRLAIVLDRVVISAPVIKDRIDQESAQIEGQFTTDQADALALNLRSGALPARVSILEHHVIGPSLGMDSIRQGIWAAVVGLALVVGAILIIYKFSGMNAFATLIVNLMLLLAVLGASHANLTLPGIAGVILTIGMAVDSNVLIFERIKEELRLGKSVRAAIDAGFDKVFSTIIDTHITALISAFFLFQFGTGPVRGFAVTLGVGLIANIFAAVYVSRTLFGILLDLRGGERISI
ncbi:MAG TPA: protein translocase subunit SecD [Acidobacteriota bacterium]|jgi:preprotein translocase subunit SecD|nr:protein translocase subunit SecD [Acidobacteriota bacterium]